MAPKDAVDRGSRRQHVRQLLAQCPLDGIGPILPEHAVIAQLYPRVKNVLLQTRLRAIPSATALMIGKRAPIQPLTRAAGNPPRYRVHAYLEPLGYGMQTAPSSHLPNHLAPLVVNGAFFAMTTSPPKPLPYRKYPANAEPQVSRER
jgi:hypothetical protein